MPLKTMLKTMLPGLLPIIVYVFVDSFFGTIAGISAALILGIGEYIYTYLKWHYSDRFIFVDTLILVFLGAVSLVSGDEIFFKLKPAFINVLFIFLFAISAFSSKNIILKMSEKYMKNISLNDDAVLKMKKLSLLMFIFFIFHTFLVVFSAFYMSQEAWAFISVTLPYVFFVIVFFFMMVYRFIVNLKKR